MSKLSPTVFDFLQDVAKNNNRDWFKANKTRYTEAQENFKAFSQTVLDAMSHHDEIERLKLHRIYRDVRFSKDKTPYNSHLSGSLNRATKSLRGGYYFHIAPGGSFIGGGFWGPNSADLKRIRTELAAAPDELRNILNEKSFKSFFGELKGEQLKSAPRGYDKDHPAIDLLRYKQYLLYKEFSDKEVFSADFAQKISDGFRAMRPFFNFMSEVLTTDENGIPL